MERWVVWMILGALYGVALGLLVQWLGQAGIAVWLVLVVAAQWWLRRRARGY